MIFTAQFNILKSLKIELIELSAICMGMPKWSPNYRNTVEIQLSSVSTY